MEITDAIFYSTGYSSDRHEVGTVVVEFDEGQSVSFDRVRRDKFEEWEASEFDSDLIPVEMRDGWASLEEMEGDDLQLTYVEEPRKKRDDEEGDNDDYLDDDITNEEVEDEEDLIHPLDFIGQLYGVPSPGFPKAPTIADDDFVGQRTGIPSPGHKKREGESK